VPIPKSPVALAFAAYKVWSKLPPERKKQFVELARKHGPTVVEQARKHGPTVARAVGRGRR
jgi:transposase-like protein